MKDPTDPLAIVSRYEIAEMVGITRQGVATVIDHADFPPPVCLIGKNQAPIFWRRDVEAFKRERDAEKARVAAAA